ncbi:allantoate amidohydrolase [uncultured Friedmanniella sp.]|uniref:allantoate amidohydrolase n=1 Tax=uncultured Friedmanniella sp. TaxID=335381 RepID=UPI0035CB4ED1
MPDPGTALRSTSVPQLLAEIADVGTDPVRGGYSRPVYGAAESDLREWFTEHAGRRGLDVETDRNGIIWAWWNPRRLPLQNAVVTGSHLDSVPGGGAFDGPLGVASALAAVDRLTASGIRPTRPLAVAVFPEEEGSRFGIACLGSRLLTGTLDPARAARLTDADGTTFAEAVSRHGLDADHLGRDEEALRRIGLFVELHVEQGRGLVDLDQPVAVASSVLAHGRWRLSVFGEGNHAGATSMSDRRDPMVAAAAVIGAARDVARSRPGARATVGRLVPVPGGTNVIASRVDLWLDARHPDDVATAALVAAIGERATAVAAEEGCTVTLTEESLSPAVRFDVPLRDRLTGVLPTAPLLATGAGHDAGVLATEVPTAMLFVRNPTGVSHSPAEHVEDADTDLGAEALARVLHDLLGPGGERLTGQGPADG